MNNDEWEYLNNYSIPIIMKLVKKGQSAVVWQVRNNENGQKYDDRADVRNERQAPALSCLSVVSKKQ